jgi:hypothetical protein
MVDRDAVGHRPLSCGSGQCSVYCGPSLTSCSLGQTTTAAGVAAGDLGLDCTGEYLAALAVVIAQGGSTRLIVPVRGTCWLVTRPNPNGKEKVYGSIP